MSISWVFFLPFYESMKPYWPNGFVSYFTSMKSSNVKSLIWNVLNNSFCNSIYLTVLFRLPRKLKPRNLNCKKLKGFQRITQDKVDSLQFTNEHLICSPYSTYKFQQDCTGRCWICLCNLYVFQFVFLFCILWNNIQVLWRHFA